MTKTRQVSVERLIDAPAADIFAIVQSPAGHAAMDGSGTVRGALKGPEKLELGTKFGMDMRLGVPYRMSSVVKEFEQDRLIAWSHFGGHRWRFEFEEVEGGTRVTETFDWSTSKFPPFIELVGYPKKHPVNMEKTLERLDQLVAEGWKPS